MYKHDEIIEITSSSMNKPIKTFSEKKGYEKYFDQATDWVFYEDDELALDKTYIKENFGFIKMKSADQSDVAGKNLIQCPSFLLRRWHANKNEVLHYIHSLDKLVCSRFFNFCPTELGECFRSEKSTSRSCVTS